jgi:hypothetical protein
MRLEPVSDSRRTTLHLLVAVWVVLSLGLLIEVDVLVFRGALRDWFKPERALPAVGFLSGFLLLLWQLDRQHRGTLVANEQAARLKLRAEIYRELSAASEAAARAPLEYAGGVVETMMDAAFRQRVAQANPSALPVSWSRDRLLEQHQKAASDVIGLLAALERWRIAFLNDFPRLRDDLSKRLEWFQSCARQTNISAVVYFSTEPRDPSAVGLLGGLNAAGERVQKAAISLAAVVRDIQVTTQNALLGPVFSGRAVPSPGSEPMPAFRVFRITELEEISEEEQSQRQGGW